MALVVAKDGAKLKSAEDQAESTFEPVPNKKMIHFGHIVDARVRRVGLDPIRKPVFDLTGLKGSFDFTLDGTKYESAPGERDDEMYMIMRALQDEVGIRLAPQDASQYGGHRPHQKNPTEN